MKTINSNVAQSALGLKLWSDDAMEGTMTGGTRHYGKIDRPTADSVAMTLPAIPVSALSENTNKSGKVVSYSVDLGFLRSDGAIKIPVVLPDGTKGYLRANTMNMHLTLYGQE